jgi:hypothetical protein
MKEWRKKRTVQREYVGRDELEEEGEKRNEGRIDGEETERRKAVGKEG